MRVEIFSNVGERSRRLSKQDAQPPLSIRAVPREALEICQQLDGLRDVGVKLKG